MTQTYLEANPDDSVLYSLEDGIARLTLNRPESYNTLKREVIGTLGAYFAAIATDEDVRVVIIASTGRAFSTGHDLKDMKAHADEAYYTALLAECSAMLQSIVNLPQPVIAQVQGIATAAGCQLMATCDLAVAARSARFATSGIHYGIFCSTPAVALSRTVARKHALEMLFTGDFISAERGAEIGLINRVVDDADLAEETGALARRIADQSQFSVRLGKSSFYRQLNQPLDEAYRGASEDLVCNLLAEDGQEGLNAFAEKRSPRWKDR